MSLVREKAVENFLERIQLTERDQRVGEGGGEGVCMRVPGWLELRKGFATYLTIAGELIIFRDGVLDAHVDERERERGGCRTSEREGGGEEESSYPLDFSGRIGSWEVTCSPPFLSREEEEEEEEEILTNPRDLLSGIFSYIIHIPPSPSPSPSRSRLSLRLHHSRKKPSLCPALSSVEMRLRATLPLLVLADADSNEEEERGEGAGVRTVLVSYRFCGNGGL
jgi:hypothetical protein